ncbi:glycoside hydrolase family 3 protein [Rhodobacteraceae bacterium NNCM2]|nr:glycoside hydrolase family 3 protein [Coraliihabitans acroporae]
MAEAAVILGLSGPRLTPKEAAFFAELSPWGFILFSRNIETREQLRQLTDDLRGAVGREAPILIDQEGGRVARLRPPEWLDWVPVRDLCEGLGDELAVMEALRLRYRTIALELREVGIDVNCVPLLDVPQRNAHPIIGDRALGWTPHEVALRGREAAAGLLDGGVLPVIKHLPGHGRALHDSHEDLPRVGASMAELRDVDFPPFVAMRDAVLGMTAHVIFDAIDADLPATLSPAAIRLIREQLGFDGLLMTDDLSMKALTGPMENRARDSLAAGCDVVLHCNGDMAEMMEIAGAVGSLSGDAARRAARALAARRAPDPAEIADLRARHDELTRELAVA